jgi:CoA:oxalate CoA-transferase
MFSGNNDLFISLCKLLGKNEWINDKRFINEELRSKHKNDLKSMIEKILKNQSAEYWLEKANSSGAPFAPVLSLTEAAQIPQIQARKMIIKAGDIRVPGNPIKISGYPDHFIRQEAASINQHSELLRHEFK